MEWVIYYVIVGILCGIISGAIGTRKNRNPNTSALWGLLLGIIGVIVVAVLPPGNPPPPQGTRQVSCPRCNAIQNVPSTDPTYECWQCKSVIDARTGSIR